MIIARVNRQTTKVCISLADACGNSVLPWSCNDTDSMHIRITRVGCCEPPPPKEMVWCGCEYKEVEPACPPKPKRTVQYDLFDLDDEGNACFYLDQLFTHEKPGRYDATIWLCGMEAGVFQLQLENRMHVTKVRTEKGEPAHCPPKPNPCPEVCPS